MPIYYTTALLLLYYFFFYCFYYSKNMRTLEPVVNLYHLLLLLLLYHCFTIAFTTARTCAHLSLSLTSTLQSTRIFLPSKASASTASSHSATPVAK